MLLPAGVRPLYRTSLGAALVGDAKDLLAGLPESSVDLVVTSPPFALRRQKTYGNVAETEYVSWLLPFAKAIHRVLKDTGSFVLDLGGAYQAGTPARSLYNFRVLLTLCDKLGYFLAEDFYWFNPAKLPSPIEWVNKRKVRAKDSVNTVWWFSKTPNPKADITKVLVPYSDRMKKLIADPESFYQPNKRPSGHDIGRGFAKVNGGALPSNLLSIPNTDSNSFYMRMCKQFEFERHPARFPEALPAFFINMLTDAGDTVVDIFAGSNTSGVACERLGRQWLSFDTSHDYLRTSIFKFLENAPDSLLQEAVGALQKPHADFRVARVSLCKKATEKAKVAPTDMLTEELPFLAEEGR